jgi:membrane protein DedA with SNARE-associated domain
MDVLSAFLDTYGLAAACTVMLIKAMGVPIPIPGDVILLATAVQAADGKIELWVAFVVLLVALTVGGTLQFLLARGPARRLVYRLGPRIRLTPERLDSVGRRVAQGGPLSICVGVLTPGVRSTIVPACGIAALPLPTFLSGLVLGSAIDIGLHFAIGYAGAEIFTNVLAPAPILILVLLVLLGLAAWVALARRKKWSRAEAVEAWQQATCPVCLTIGAAAPLRYADHGGVGSAAR